MRGEVRGLLLHDDRPLRWLVKNSSAKDAVERILSAVPELAQARVRARESATVPR